MPGHTRRLEAQIGAPIAPGLTADALAELVSRGVLEDEQVEFKGRLHRGAKSDGITDGPAKKKAKSDEREELSKDVLALANSTGGVIVVGVEEVEGQTSVLSPVPIGDLEEIWMQGAVVDRCRPMPSVEIFKVPTEDDPTKGFWVLSVPPSPYAPHALLAPNGPELRYPIRRGTTTEWLTEPELADRYRNRFAGARSQVERLEEVFSDGRRSLSSEGLPWLVLSSVPSVGRVGPLDAGLYEQTDRWVADLPPSPFDNRRPQGSVRTVGVGRVVLSYASDVPGKALFLHAELHRDGSAFVAIQLGLAGSDREPAPGESTSISATEIFDRAVVALSMAAGYAVDVCGLGGDLVVSFSLEDPSLPGEATRPMVLGDGRSGYAVRPSPVVREAVGRHTVDLDAATGSTAGLLMSTRLVMTEVFQAFGLAEPQLIESDGTIPLARMGMPGSQQVQQWATQVDAPTR